MSAPLLLVIPPPSLPLGPLHQRGSSNVNSQQLSCIPFFSTGSASDRTGKGKDIERELGRIRRWGNFSEPKTNKVCLWLLSSLRGSVLKSQKKNRFRKIQELCHFEKRAAIQLELSWQKNQFKEK